MDINEIARLSKTKIWAYLLEHGRDSKISDIQDLLDNGADIGDKEETQKITPLHIACSPNLVDNFEIVKFLVDNGDDINAQDYVGNTALIRASSGDGPEYLNIVRYLVENGADPYIENEGGYSCINGVVSSDEIFDYLSERFFNGCEQERNMRNIFKAKRNIFKIKN